MATQGWRPLTTKLNAAARLFRVLSAANRIDDKLRAVDAWAKLLDVDESTIPKKALAVANLLCVLGREVTSIREGLGKAPVPPEIYEGHLARLENCISPAILEHPWSNVRQYLPVDTMTALSYWIHLLPDEESEISEETLASIRSCVAELKKVFDDATISDRLRSLITHHVELIERALKEYRISGAQAFREVRRTALGEIIEARDDIAVDKDHPAVSKLRRAWDVVNAAADTALKSEKIASLGQRLTDLLSGIF